MNHIYNVLPGSVTRTLLGLFLFLALCSGSLMAQDLTIAGTVTDKASGLKVAGAAVKVKGSNLGAISDKNGSFSIKVANAARAVLTVTYIGYKTEEITITASTSDLKIALEEDILKTSEIIVTGAATGIKRASVPNSIGVISAKELIPAPAQTVDQAFAGKFAGITIRQNTGAPGGGISVNLRGITTLVGNGQPLYIIDGVVMSNDAIQGGLDAVTAATGVGAQNPQGQPTNRLADLNPNDIEDIQVLKGGSAAAIYGSKAAAGVIVITTKKGQSGKTKIDVSQQIGFNSILRKQGTLQHTAETVAKIADFKSIAIDGRNLSGDSLVRANGFLDQEELLYGQKGLISETSISASGGNETTQFFGAATLRSEDGIMKNTGYTRANLRLNVSQQISDAVKVDISVGYTNSTSERGFTGNANGAAVSVPYAAAFLPSFVDLRRRADGTYPSHPFNGSNPFEVIDLMHNREQINRFITAGKLDWSIFHNDNQSLRFVAQGGADYFTQYNNIMSPIGTQHERANAIPGQVIDNRANSLFSNVFLNLIHNYTTDSRLSFTTSVGAQYENRNVNALLINAQGFVTVQENVNSASQINTLQTITKQYDRGYYIQEEIDLDSKIYLALSGRFDQSSNFGDPSTFVFFPKVAGSVRLSQYDFWNSMRSTFDEFKVRAAYGESGNQPFAAAKFGGLVQNNITGTGVGLIIPARRGNPAIRPERTAELELGFDANLSGGFAGIEFTYYTRKITDLVVQRNLPLSSGYATEFANAGTMSANGIEIALKLNPVRTELIDWNFNVNFLRARQTIDNLSGIDPYTTGGFGKNLGAYRIEAGLSPTTLIGRETVIAGNVTDQSTIISDAFPKFNLGINSTLRVGDFSLYFLIDHQNGGAAINLTRFLMDLGNITGDGLDAIAARTVARAKTTPWIEDATNTRLREVSLMYTLNKSTLSSVFGETFSYMRFGVTGRNLLLITNYSGYDPEVSNFGNVAIGGSVDVCPFPSARSVYFNLSFGF